MKRKTVCGAQCLGHRLHSWTRRTTRGTTALPANTCTAAWQSGGCSSKEQNVRGVVHSDLLENGKSMTSDCLIVGMYFDVVLADSILFVLEGWLDKSFFLHHWVVADSADAVHR